MAFKVPDGLRAFSGEFVVSAYEWTNAHSPLTRQMREDLVRCVLNDVVDKFIDAGWQNNKSNDSVFVMRIHGIVLTKEELHELLQKAYAAGQESVAYTRYTELRDIL